MEIFGDTMNMLEKRWICGGISGSSPPMWPTSILRAIPPSTLIFRLHGNAVRGMQEPAVLEPSTEAVSRWMATM